ncbi:hypothetical protein [Microbulbifer sp. ANSA005]|uniref:hypothetical protein n=1 Tax=Microbulbifer sp. ANSA005 TaxID=3243362 RepID=UPI0040420D8F
MRQLILLILIFTSNAVIAETFKEKALWKMSTYYCNGNPNFLRCVKPEVLADLQGCVTYVVQNSTDCSAKYLSNNEGLSDKEQMKIAIEFTQCALLEIMKSENVKESEFEECFQKRYDESIRSPILKK